MSRISGYAAIVSVAALSLLLAGNATAAPKTVVGTVGPGYTITLKLNGAKVTKLKAGVQYRFVISDRSSIHDFHLTGPGTNRVVTSVDFTGTKSFVLRLKKGTYNFVCDPHASFMHGSFKAA
jgi:plastocyanin